MKIIFLDIDGVLNSIVGSAKYLSFMEASKLQLLKDLIIESSADGVVIISDRRYSKYDMEDILDAFDEFEIYLIGSIRNPEDSDYEDNRGKQIQDYLENTKENITSIVILDDNDDGISSYFNEEFIRINRYDGLTRDDVDRAIEILG